MWKKGAKIWPELGADWHCTYFSMDGRGSPRQLICWQPLHCLVGCCIQKQQQAVVKKDLQIYLFIYLFNERCFPTTGNKIPSNMNQCLLLGRDHFYHKVGVWVWKHLWVGHYWVNFYMNDMHTGNFTAWLSEDSSDLNITATPHLSERSKKGSISLISGYWLSCNTVVLLSGVVITQSSVCIATR